MERPGSTPNPSIPLASNASTGNPSANTSIDRSAVRFLEPANPEVEQPTVAQVRPSDNGSMRETHQVPFLYKVVVSPNDQSKFVAKSSFRSGSEIKYYLRSKSVVRSPGMRVDVLEKGNKPVASVSLQFGRVFPGFRNHFQHMNRYAGPSVGASVRNLEHQLEPDNEVPGTDLAEGDFSSKDWTAISAQSDHQPQALIKTMDCSQLIKFITAGAHNAQAWDYQLAERLEGNEGSTSAPARIAVAELNSIKALGAGTTVVWKTPTQHIDRLKLLLLVEEIAKPHLIAMRDLSKDGLAISTSVVSDLFGLESNDQQGAAAAQKVLQTLVNDLSRDAHQTIQHAKRGGDALNNLIEQWQSNQKNIGWFALFSAMAALKPTVSMLSSAASALHDSYDSVMSVIEKWQAESEMDGGDLVDASTSFVQLFGIAGMVILASHLLMASHQSSSNKPASTNDANTVDSGANSDSNSAHATATDIDNTSANTVNRTSRTNNTVDTDNAAGPNKGTMHNLSELAKHGTATLKHGKALVDNGAKASHLISEVRTRLQAAGIESSAIGVVESLIHSVFTTIDSDPIPSFSRATSQISSDDSVASRLPTNGAQAQPQSQNS